jgi:5S rRNA maturation endonuclease (ribonuclease M5)
MAYKAVFRIKPITMSEVSGAVGHITRELIETDSHIDRSKENITLIGSDRVSEIKAQLKSEADIHKVLDKRAGVVFVEGFMSANRDYFDEHFAGWQLKPDVLKPWIDANLRFFESGKVGIVKSAVLHLDEEAPHIHFVGVPVTTVTRGNRYGSADVERLSYNAMFSDSKQHVAECRRLGTTSTDTKLGRLQTDYAKSVESLNLVRGVTSSAKHVTPKQFRKMLGSEIRLTNPDFSLKKPSLFSYNKTHEANKDRVDKLKKYLTGRANAAANSAKASRVKNTLLTEKIAAQEETIMQLTNTIQDQAKVLKENKEFISASRLLSKDAVIEAFGYTDAAYADYNFNKKFNAIDFVKHVEKCDFNQALVLISEQFPADAVTASAAQSEVVKKSVKAKIDKPRFENLDSELSIFKSEISLFDFARAQGFNSSSQSVHGKSSVTMSDGQKKIVVARKSGIDVFFDVKNSNISGSIIDFCKHYLGQNLGQVRKTLRSWTGGIVEQVNRPKTPTVLTESKAGFTDKTLDFYALKPCTGSKFLAKRGIQIAEDEIRIDDRGNACFPHYCSEGFISGWEVKGDGFKGFSTGGKKGFGLVTTGAGDGVVIAESMLDALSYAQLHKSAIGACMSTGGGASDDQLETLAKDVLTRNVPVFIATDNDEFGDQLAAKLQALIPSAERIKAPENSKDWNEYLMKSVVMNDIDTNPLLSTKLSTKADHGEKSETRIRPSMG